MATPKRAPNVITLLTEDHQKVTKLFKDFESSKAGKRKAELVAKICKELIVHTTVEEEIVYPAAREAMDEEDLMDEADVEHAGAKSLIAQLQKAQPGSDHYDAKVKVLSEYIKHHVKEEREKMFPKMRKAKMDLAGLGQQVAQRKKEMMRSM